MEPITTIANETLKEVAKKTIETPHTIKKSATGLKEIKGKELTGKEIERVDKYFKNLSPEIQNKIKSTNEILVYANANLKEIPINGKNALIRPDSYMNSSENISRMEKGKSPLDPTKKPIELHHIGQDSDSPFAELTHSEHISNDGILHEKNIDSRINRSEFALQRKAYYKARSQI